MSAETIALIKVLRTPHRKLQANVVCERFLGSRSLPHDALIGTIDRENDTARVRFLVQERVEQVEDPATTEHLLISIQQQNRWWPITPGQKDTCTRGTDGKVVVIEAPMPFLQAASLWEEGGKDGSHR